MRFLGKYDSLGVLGKGSMGQVHAARPVGDPATTVVVKVLRRDLVDSARAEQFFEREVQYTSRLRHPYIVRILDAGMDVDAGPCLVLAFVPGSTLDQVLLKERRLESVRAARLAGCLCHALESAHTAGVIHRDLKPANLMVMNAGTQQEHVKVMDFGLSQLASKPFLSKEQFEGAQFVRAQGTPAYISPEQLRGDDIDGRADLYAIGVILFESLTGRLPFPDADVDKLLQAHLHRPPPRFAEIGIRDVPQALEAVVLRCLSKYPPDRHASPRELTNELGRALNLDLWADTTPLGEMRTEAELPMAEDVPPEPESEPNTLVRKAEAWMPDRIAVIKLGGFLTDVGGELVNSQPGLLQAKFAPPGPPATFLTRLFGGAKATGDVIALDIALTKPNPTEAKLIVTAIFRVAGGGAPRSPQEWTTRCLKIFEEMKRYLMAG